MKGDKMKQVEKGDAIKIVRGQYKGKNGTILKRSLAMGPGWLVASGSEVLLVLDSEIQKA
jgi:hypothetical protein